MKMEPIRSSETSAIKTQTPGNYPKKNILQIYCQLMQESTFFIRTAGELVFDEPVRETCTSFPSTISPPGRIMALA